MSEKRQLVDFTSLLKRRRETLAGWCAARGIESYDRLCWQLGLLGIAPPPIEKTGDVFKKHRDALVPSPREETKSEEVTLKIETKKEEKSESHEALAVLEEPPRRRRRTKRRKAMDGDGSDKDQA